jgi:sarcosine oxidase
MDVTAPGSPLPPEAEFVVVGAGLIGLSTAWHLARRGREVAVLERATVGHAGGGSHGSGRIFRLGYDDPRYVEMAKLALPLWRELEAESGTELLTTTGQITFGPGLDRLHAGLLHAGAPAEMWAAADVAACFPEVAAGGPALFEPSSGVIHAEQSLRALRSGVGARLHEGVDVLDIHDHGRAVEVLSDAGGLTASGVICCGGPWSRPLLARAGIGLHLSTSVEQVAYFAGARPISTPIPVIVERGQPMLYGLPTPDGRAFKVGRHHAGPRVPPDDADMAPDPVEDRRLAAGVERLLPGFDPRPVRSERCFYDNSPDEDFVIDRVGRITFGAGTSGHGFKFGPLLGELLADLAEGRPPRSPITWLGSSRPGLRASRTRLG